MINRNMFSLMFILCSWVCYCSCYHHRISSVRISKPIRQMQSRSQELLLRETLELKGESSIFLLNATRFGLDVALADGLKNFGEYMEAGRFAREVTTRI